MTFILDVDLSTIINNQKKKIGRGKGGSSIQIKEIFQNFYDDKLINFFLTLFLSFA